MAGEWDPVEMAPLEPARRVERQVPFNPMVGQRNALAPATAKVIATVPPRPSTAAERITFRAATPEEQEKNPGLVQVDSRGQMHFAPAGVLSAKKTGPVKLSPQDAGYISKIRTQAEETKNMSSLYDEFVGLNDSVDTGGLVGLATTMPGINSVANALDGKRARMSAIVSQVTPAQRNGLPGAASDRDVAMFKDSTVGIDKPKRTNQATRDAAKALATRHGDYVAFLEAFAKKNGNLLGAQERWDEYKDAHPLFEGKDADGYLKLAKRVPWRYVMSDLRPDAPASSPAQPANGPAVEEHWERDPKTGKLVRVK